jgi:transposase-like protein
MVAEWDNVGLDGRELAWAGSEITWTLRTVYRATDAAAGQAALDAFAQGSWGIKYPAIAQSWRRNWVS